MGSTPLGYCWFIYKIGARTGRLTGQFETYAPLIMLNQDKPYLKQIAQEEGYRTEELIAAEKIKVYIAESALMNLKNNSRRSRQPTLVPARIDPELGIEARSFDNTINKMNEIQDAIVWGGDE